MTETQTTPVAHTAGMERALSLAALFAAVLGAILQTAACPAPVGTERALANEGASADLGVTVTGPQSLEEPEAEPSEAPTADNDRADADTGGAEFTDVAANAEEQSETPDQPDIPDASNLPDNLPESFDECQRADLADTPCGPDATRAEETGMPVAGGESVSPMEVLIVVAQSQQTLGSPAQISQTDAESGRILYRKDSQA